MRIERDIIEVRVHLVIKDERLKHRRNKMNNEIFTIIINIYTPS